MEIKSITCKPILPMTKEFWNERYGKAEFAYGEEPNEFLKEQLKKLEPGKILFPADGEGRNSVYTATCGWDAHAFDQSEEGQKKALQLAKKKGVKVDYMVSTPTELPYPTKSFDAVGLIFAHFPGELKVDFLKKITTYLKPGGIVILEAFSKAHVQYKRRNPAVGGPEDLSILYSEEEIHDIFPGFETVHLSEDEVNLNEGLYHKGQGMVIRFVGRKK